MKIITNLFVCLMLSFFIIPNVQGQKMWGFLNDKDGDPITNQEVVIEIQICKNGDSLFTKKDTVMTDMTFGGFESDLTKEFNDSDAMNGDTIEYSLKFTHGGETITTNKKVWSVVLKSKTADHASTADEASHAITSDQAMSAVMADEASTALTAEDCVNALNAINAVNASFADEANTALTADHASTADNATFADESIFSNAAWGLEPVNLALPNNGDQGILLAENAGGTVTYSNISPSTPSTGIDILSSTAGTFTFSNIPAPPGTTTFFTIQNTGSETVPVALTFEDSLEGNLGIKSDGNGGNSIVVNPLMNAFEGTQNQRTYNIQNTGNGTARFVPVVLGNDTSSNVAFFTNPTAQVHAIGTTTSARLNYLNAYGGMFTGAVCADYYVENRSPLLDDIESEKSLSQLNNNNELWSLMSNGESEGFVEAIAKTYPSLVRDIPIEIDGQTIKERYVHYTALIPMISKAVKEQSDIIASQQKQIDELKVLVNQLLENTKN